MPRHIVALVFRGRRVAGELTENAEAVAFRWATADEVPQLATEAYAVRLLDALTRQGADAPAIRSHDGTNLL